jgi:hypothetical protein
MMGITHGDAKQSTTHPVNKVDMDQRIVSDPTLSWGYRIRSDNPHVGAGILNYPLQTPSICLKSALGAQKKGGGRRGAGMWGYQANASRPLGC